VTWLHRNPRLLLAGVGAAVIALLAVALLPGHDGGPAHVAGIANPGVAPGPTAHGGTAHVADTRLSAQEAADAAAQTPTAEGPRSEVQPLAPRAFRAPVRAYRAYAIGQARAMGVAVAALSRALHAGDRRAARAAWQRAYDRYLRLGAAYGALGALDRAIDGTPGGLRRGVRDPRFTGLHRIEHDLWTGAPTVRTLPFARRLQSDVRRLPRVLARMTISPLDYATRAHEILEDAQRDQLSGVAAPWSGAGLLATAADFAATEKVIGTLRPVLSGRGDALVPVEFELRAFGARLRAIRARHDGRWPALGGLSAREREGLDGGLGALLEALSAVPGALETQLPPTIPAIVKARRP
jgi:iron uptake system EfeUOB component EfeO/EfeM